MDDSLFDRAGAAVSCEDVAERGGRTVLRKGRGVCPLNGCGANSKAQPFAVLDSGRRWKCWSCDPKGGDVVDLEHKLYSSGSDTLADAARRLVGGVAQEESAESRERRSKARAKAEEEAMADAAWRTDLARNLWREAGAALGSPAQTYLEARAIRGPVAARALALLRFHPAAYHSGDPAHGVRLPAMIGLIMTEFGPTGGVHVTYLSPDGKRKTHRSPAKRMWGPQGVRVAVGDDLMSVPGGIWLTRPDAPGPLVVAEGIENALSRAILLSGDLSLPVRAAAAGSLDRLAGFEVTDPKTGARDVWSVTPDPLRPPFTWPEDPANPFGTVEVATDGDMSPVKVLGWAGKKKTKPTIFERHAAERARVCGALGVAGWRRRLAPDSETVVKATRSPLGQDFNDVLKATASSEMGGVGPQAARGRAASDRAITA